MLLLKYFALLSLVYASKANRNKTARKVLTIDPKSEFDDLEKQVNSLKAFYKGDPKTLSRVLKENLDMCAEYHLMDFHKLSDVEDSVKKYINVMFDIFGTSPSMKVWGPVQLKAIEAGRPEVVHQVRAGIKFFNPKSTKSDLELKGKYEKSDNLRDAETNDRLANVLFQAPDGNSSPDQAIAFCIKQLALQLGYNRNQLKSWLAKMDFRKRDMTEIAKFIQFYKIVVSSDMAIWMLLRKLRAILRIETEAGKRAELGNLAPTAMYFIQNTKFNDINRNEPIYFLRCLEHGIIKAHHDQVIAQDTKTIAQINFTYLTLGKVTLALTRQVPESHRPYWHYIYREHKDAVSSHQFGIQNNQDWSVECLHKISRWNVVDAESLYKFVRRTYVERIKKFFDGNEFHPLIESEVEALQTSLNDEYLLKNDKKRQRRGPKVQAKTPKRKPAKVKYLDDPSPTDNSCSITIEDDHESSSSDDERETNEIVLDDESLSGDDDDPDEGLAEELQGYTEEYQNYNRLKGLKIYQYTPRVDPEASTGTNREILTKKDAVPNAKVRQAVSFLDTSDLRAMLGQADQVYRENFMNDVANIALSDATIKLQWIFNPSVIIGQESFLFLCQLFSLVNGSGHLSFDTFISTVQVLGGSEFRTKKNRKFKFKHSFLLDDGQQLVPPTGSVHREHASSRFNYNQVAKLLEHAGAHPYFFRVLMSKTKIQRI